MGKQPHIADTLTELRAMGVRLDLDDFGTGYSSLSYLHQFPIDTLKIDKSFIQRIGESAEGLEIVHTILSLAKSLDMRVVAEGVENEKQAEALRKLNCGFAQGYHLGRPVDAAIQTFHAPVPATPATPPAEAGDTTAFEAIQRVVGRVSVDGNVSTDSTRIVRSFEVPSGIRYSPEAVRRGIRKLYALGIFDETRPFGAWLITLSLHHPYQDFPASHRVLKLGALENTSSFAQSRATIDHIRWVKQVEKSATPTV